jgi:hypothetical protein
LSPEAIKAMSTAFDDVCAALKISDGEERSREIIATRIVDVARSGVVDAKALGDRVIKSMAYA